MFKKRYSFCGLCFEIQSENEIKDSHFFPDFLSEDEPDAIVRVVNNSIPERKGEFVFESRFKAFYQFGEKEYMYSFYFSNEKRAYKDYALRIADSDGITLIVDFDGGMWDSMIFDALNIPDMLIKNNGGLLHSSFIIYKDEAILFSANKQVGKSTQAALWEKYRKAEIINGDRAGLVFEGERLYACATPFCGSSKICKNVKAPVRAIVLLEQAKENHIKKVDSLSAFMQLIGNLSYNEWDKESLEKATLLIQKAVSAVPVYKLSCLPDRGAVEALEKQLYK